MQYDVTTFTGTVGNTSKFAPPPAPGVMPWWGNSVIAGEFATAVGKGLGEVAGNAPFFAYEIKSEDGGGIIINGTYLAASVNKTRRVAWGISAWDQMQPTAKGRSGFWAQATLVPGP